MKPAWLAAALLLVAGGAWGQDAPDPGDPIGAPQPDKSVRDPVFRVVARHFGLERRVEMYQWTATARGYARAWSARPIDSAAFAPGHANPAFPLDGGRWLAKSISVDGKPLDAEVVASLGEWRDFRPSFSALPGNLSATFQPEGDGLGSAENPLDPQVGDLRIRWRELVLPPLQDRIVLRDGRWRLPPAAEPAPGAGTVPAPAAPQRESRRLSWLLGGGTIVVVAAALAAARRRRRASSRPSGN